MAAKFYDRYGIPGNEVNNLSHRWLKQVKKDTDWEDFNAFLFWCSVSGYQKGRELRRHNPERPFGPDNCYWYDWKIAKEQERQEKIKKREEASEVNQSSFCKACTKICRAEAHGGCKAWRDWFVKNWNENICRRPKQEAGRQVFRYEHPDQIREGIGG